jgi:flagellin
MLVIKNNLMAENSARHLGRNYDALAKSVERLSSGLRINGAKDDAAGLAVRELMRADIAVIKQGSRNAMDGISMLQTMEGAMATIDSALIRMKELAEQAATESYSANQRAIMDNEYQQMSLEISRIANDTLFNSIHMLDSGASTNAAVIHFGVGSQITVNSVNVTACALGIQSTDLTTSISSRNALAALETAIKRKDSARASFGYMMNRLESTSEVLNIQSENLMASESRISDVDVATEMASLTRNQVLSQAGVSMLAQANGMPQMALTLLRG